MLSLYCPQSAAEKSILINSISIPRLREQQNYEGKRMSSDTCKQEKWCLLLCVLFCCGATVGQAVDQLDGFFSMITGVKKESF